jgi:hypothetical protein
MGISFKIHKIKLSWFILRYYGSETTSILLTLRGARKRKENVKCSVLFIHVSLSMGIVQVLSTFLRIQEEEKKTNEE